MKRFYFLLSLVFVQFLFVFKSNAQVNKQDSLALVDLYNATNGAYWFYNDGWLNGPVKNWRGVYLNSNNRVTDISLVSNNLVGKLPASIKNLAFLESISLENNVISGSIPAGITKLKELYYLSLYGNKLTGKIPTAIGDLTNLVDLLLNDNSLTGVIPPSLGNCPKLFALFLSRNQLTGSIPASLGNTSLCDVEITDNKFSGIIPESFSRLTNMSEFYVSNNQLSGTIPGWFGSFINLQGLSFSNNKFTGNIPDSICKLSLNGDYMITKFGFSDNQLSGKIPLSLKDLGSYCHPTIFNNHFTFDGLEELVTSGPLPNITYDPQLAIPMHVAKTGTTKKLSVTAGGTLNNNTYRWYRNGVLVATKTGDSSLDIAKNGKYYVSVSNSVVENSGYANLVLTSNTLSVNINSKLAANGNEAKFKTVTTENLTKTINSISISPNPVSNSLHINATAGLGIFPVSIVNETGAIVMSNFSQKYVREIAVEKLSKGVYFLIVKAGEKVLSLKFIKL